MAAYSSCTVKPVRTHSYTEAGIRGSGDKNTFLRPDPSDDNRVLLYCYHGNREQEGNGNVAELSRICRPNPEQVITAHGRSCVCASVFVGYENTAQLSKIQVESFLLLCLPY